MTVPGSRLRRAATGRWWPRLGYLAIAATVVAAACVDRTIVGVTVGTVTIAPASPPPMIEGDSLLFEATVRDVEGRELRRADVTWSVDADSLVRLDSTGLVVALAEGVATIQAEFREVTGTVSLTIRPAPRISVEPDSATLVGEADGDPPVPVVLAVRNAGGANLTGLATTVEYDAGGPEDWLTATLSEDRDPADLELTADTDGLTSGRYSATVRITSPDAREPFLLPVRLSLAGFTVAETGSGSVVSETGTVDSLSVRLDAVPDTVVTLAVSSADVGEVSVSPDSLTFTPSDWDQLQYVVLTGVNELVRDGDRVTDVVLAVDPDRSDDRYDPITDRTVAVTTLDDDDGTFTLDAATSELEVGEDGSTDGFTVVLDAQPLDTVVFRLERRDTTEVALSPAVLFFAPEVWDQPQNVTVQGVDDALLDGTQSSFVYVEVDSTRSDPAFVALGRDSISVRTLDDDAAGFTVTPTPPPSPSVDTTTVSEAGASDTITVVLGAQPATDVVLSVTPSDGGEVSVAPATLTFGSAGWNVPQTVVVSGVDDLVLDGDQVTSLTFAIVPAASDDDFDGLAPIAVPVTTLDDDLPGLVVVESSGTTVTDEAGAQPDQFTVALAAQPAGPVAFDLASANELEVTVSPSRLTFPSADWNVPQPVTVTGVDERFDDGDQVVPVVLTVDPAASDDDYDALAPDTVLVTNVDDDTAGFTLVESAGGTLVSEAGSNDTITIVLDARPVDSVVVTLLAADTTEVVVAPALLSFDTDDWNVAQDIIVTGVDDGEPDGNRFSIVAIGVSGALSDAAFATVPDQAIQVTTINDDTVSVDVTPTSGLQTDEDGATATFDVVLGSQPLADVVVTVGSDDGGEGTAAPGSLTFSTSTWDVPQTVTVTGIDDAIDDGNVAYSILTSVTSSDPSYAALDPPDVSVTNIDNDAAPALAIGGASVTEGDAGTVDVVLTITQSLESTQDVSVAWATVDGSAEAGTDYVAGSGTVTFPAGGPLSQTVSVTVNGDLLDEGASESFDVVLSAPVNATIATATGTATILDDDGAPTVTVDDVTVLEGDAGNVTAVFTVTQGAPSALTTSISYATADGTASDAAGDYTGEAGTLNFVPGGPLTQQISVTVHGDLLDEGASEVFSLLLHSPVNVVIADPSGTATITDDDDPPSLSVDDVAVLEGDGGTTSAVFTVTQLAPSGLVVGVSYTTADGTAAAGPDYTTAAGGLTFVPGGPLSQTVTVVVVGDLLDEGASENFTLALSAPSNATVADGSGVGTITDDDDPPSLSIDDVTVTEGDAGTVDASFTVTLSAPSGLAVTADYATADGTAVAGADYTTTIGSLTFPAGGSSTQTVTVPVLGDLIDEGAPETFTLTLSNPGNATITAGTGTGTITDDDDPPSLTISDVTITEGDAGSTNAIVAVTLTAPSGLPVSVDYGTVGGTATAGADYTTTTGTLDFVPGGPLALTVAVPILGDLLDEGVSEAFTVDLSNATNAGIGDSSGTVTITDDDGAPTLSIDDVTVTEGDVGTVSADFTVTLSDPSGLVVSVDFGTSDGTATAGVDYLAASGPLTFTPGGPLTQPVSVTVNGDLTDEAAGEDFFVTLSNAVNAAIADPSGTGTITDDDDPPSLSIDDVTVTEGDAGTVAAQLTVTMSVASSQTVTANWATSDGTATAGADYIAAGGTVTFVPAGPLSQTVTVSVNGDLFDEGASEAFTVDLTAPVNATIGTGTGSVTITDDDDPPSLSIDDVTITEGNAGQVNAIFTVTQSAPSAQTVSVDYATADGTATVADSDYDPVTGSLSFVQGGPLTQQITVPVNGDSADEGTAESFTVELSNVVNATLADATGTATIIDDDGTPTLFMDDVTVLEGDAGTVDAVFTVTKSSSSASTITVDYATADGTATDGTDYVGVTGTLTFPPGPAGSQTVTVLVNGDLVDEGTLETFTLNLSNAVNATILGASEVGTITDDDATSVAIDDVTLVEGDAGPTNASFTVTLSTPRSETVSVDFTTADGTATAGADYTTTVGTLTFLAGGALSQTIDVPVIGDLVDEGVSESFSVLLSGIVNATLSDPVGVGTITDDDDVPTLSVDDVAVTEGDAGTTTAVFTVSLSAPSSQPVDVGYATSDGSATAGTDYVATSGALTFTPGGPLTLPVSVTVNGDVLDEGAAETFALSLSGATNATIADGTGIGTITDDDAAPSLTIDDVAVAEGDAGTVSAVFTVTQSTASGQTVSVDYATADGSATAGTDYVTTIGTLTFAPGGPLTRTITVVVSGDLLDEGASEDFSLLLTNPSNATLAVGTGTGTITDDDDPPTLSISDATVTEGDAGTVTAQFTVSQSAPSGLSVTVDYATADGTATVAGGDYLAENGTLTFVPGGPLFQTVSVTVNGDVVDEGALETFTVVLSGPVNGTLGDASGTGTITDDDNAPSLSIDDVNVGEGDAGTVNAVFTVTRNGTSSEAITVDFATADGTAQSASDYGATSGQLTFPPGGPATRTITVLVNGDLLDEGVSETFTVNLTNAVNAVIADPSGTGTITDDDGAPTLTIDDVTVVEGDAGTVNAVFTVTQSAVSGQAVTVDWATADGSATAGDDYAAASGTLTFPAGGPLTRTLTVVVSGDVIDEGASETFTVDLSNAQNAAITDASGQATITDDDTATLSIDDVTIQEGNSGTTNAVFTVTKSVPSNAVVTVNYATADGSATAGVDYTATSGVLTFLTGGPLTQSVSVVVTGDQIEEGDAETFTVELSGAVNATVTDGSGLGTIVDDEGLPTFFVDDVTVVEGDAGTVNAVFTVTQSTASAQIVTVEYATADGTAESGSDYTTTTGTLTFNPGGPLTQPVSVPVLGDGLDEGASEAFTLELTNPVNAAVLDGTGVGTITDDDDATLSIDDVTVLEGDAGAVSAVFTVTQSIASTQIVTVDWASADGTATAGADYASASGTLTFNPGGALSQTVAIAVSGDVLDEGVSEAFTVELSNAINASIADASGTGTITDDDDQPSLSIDDVSVAEGDAGGLNAVFTVTLSAASSQTVSVGYATADGTATAGADYVATSGTLQFDPGGPLSQIVSVFVDGDLLDEGASETFTLGLSGVVNATIADGTGVGTIVDDDDAPSLSIDDVIVTEGNAGTVAAVFTVSLSAQSGLPVMVDYASADGTASAGPDYTAVTGTLTFAPGSALTRSITVLVSGDLLDEGASETFAVALSTPVNATLGTSSGTGTITDDDGAPSLSISDVTLGEGDAGSTNAVFTVSLSGASGQAVSVSYATQDGSASAGEDYVATSGTLNFAPGGPLSGTVTVSVTGDLLDEGAAEAFTVELSGATNASISDATGTGTIIDDDDPPTLSIDDVTVSEGDAGTVNASFTVTLSAASGRSVSVDWSTADGTASAGSDYVSGAGGLTFNPGDLTQPVVVVVNGDLVDEATEDFSVNLTNAVNAALADGTGVGTINDDDAPPSFSIGNTTVTEGDAGSVTASFTVTLSSASGLATSVSWATADGTATVAGGDYDTAFGTLSFAPGGPLTQQVDVTVNGDLIDEGASEDFSVDLSAPVNATLGVASGTGTITDDDSPPTISIADVTVSEGNSGTTNAVFVVSLDQPTGLTASVAWATLDGTATVADADYVSASGTVTFVPGGPLTQQVVVLVNGDLVDEGASETFSVALSAPSNAILGTSSATGTIVDDEGPPTLRVDDVTVVEGDVATVDAVFTVTLSAPSSQTVSVDYATSDGTASAGTDYVAVNGTLDFLPGGPLTQTVTVTVNGDLIDEGVSEVFNFELSNAVNATILDASEIGTIMDDDAASFSIDDVTVLEGDAGTTSAVFTVTQSVESAQFTQVAYASSDGSATVADTDYVATSGTLTFAPGGPLTQQISVTVNGDPLDEGLEETFTLALSSPTNATIADGTGDGTITDDDDPPTLSIDDVTVVEGDAGTVSAVFTVTQSAQSGRTTLVDFDAVAGTATLGSDFQATTGTLTFVPGGPLSQPVTVLVFGDVLDEGASEAFTVELTDPADVVIADGSGTGTITDDDDPPSVSISDATVTEGDAGTVTALFTVSLSAPSGLPTSVDFATSDGTATVADGDYLAASGTLSFPVGGPTSQDISVTVNGDALDEGSAETFAVTLGSPVDLTIGDGDAVGTITDDDDPPTFSIDDVTVLEGDVGTVAAIFTVTQSAASGLTTSVDYTTVDGSATVAGSDYVAASGTLTFTPGGPLTQQISVTVNGDEIDESGFETFNVVLSNPSQATILDGSGLGTITDDEGVQLSISDVTLAEGDAGTTNFTFTVTMDVASSQTVTVDFATSDGTATVADGDYLANANTLTFLTGGSLSQDIVVVVNGDTRDEIDETFDVTLSNATNAAISDPVGIGTITDDDPTPSLSIDDVGVNEGDGTTTFTVTLSAVSGQTVQVAYATSDDTAVEPGDYTATSGTLTFAPGVTTQPIVVPIGDDALDETLETFDVTLSAPSNATIADGVGVATITDDDPAPSISIDDLAVNEADGTATFTVTLSAMSGRTVQVVYATSDDTAEEPEDYTVASGTLTFAPGVTTQPIVVSIIDDDLDENLEQFEVLLNEPSNASISDGIGAVVITDNDPPPSLSIDDVAVNEGDGTATFTVTLSTASGRSVQVDYGTSDGSAVATEDYTATSGTLVFAAGETSQPIVVTVTDDNFEEPAETFDVVLSTPVNAVIGDATGVGTITDDDAAGITVGAISGPTSEAGGQATFTITLDSEPRSAVTIGLSSSDASEGSVAPTSAVLTSANWNSGVLVTATGQDDVFADGDTVYSIVTAAATSGDADYSGVDPADVTVTNNDNETPTIEIEQVGGDTDVDEGGMVQNLNITLGARPEGDVVIQITESDLDDSELSLSTTTLTFTTLNWNVDQNVQVTPLLDGIDDGNQAITITFTVDDPASVTGYAGVSNFITANILDIDPP